MAAPTQHVANPRTDAAAVAHLLMSSGFLAVGGLLTAGALAAMRFPASFDGLLSFGRLRPMAMTATILGWLTIGLIGGIYYVLPRLTGTHLRRPGLALTGLWGLAAITGLGLVAHLLGWGDGSEPLGLPWWLDGLVALSVVPAVAVTIDTVRHRTEKGVFVTLWFVMAGVVWLLILAIVAAVPNLSAVGRALQSVVFSSGFWALWVTGVGTGLIYYTTVKATGNPLANRQLARVGFWSLAFAATWLGPVQVALGPTPDWLDPVAAVLGLAFPIAAIANLNVVATTIGPEWRRLNTSPELAAGVGALAIAVAVGMAAGVASFGTTSALVGMTAYWDGIGYGALFGIGGLASAAWAYQALPAMTGRTIPMGLARRHVRLTLIGVPGVMVLLMAAGIISGLTWTGGAFTGSFVPAGEGWAESTGAAGVFSGLAVAMGLVALTGQLAHVLAVLRTVTSGRVTVQEVLVEVGDD